MNSIFEFEQGIFGNLWAFLMRRFFSYFVAVEFQQLKLRVFHYLTQLLVVAFLRPEF
jgi:hypothetical protein